MNANLLTRSTLAITGAVFSLGTVVINPASAAGITYDFFFDIGDYNQSSPLTGRFSYDEATEVKVISPPDMGYPWPTVEQRYEVDSIEFLFQDRIYTQADSVAPIQWHTASFLDGPEGWGPSIQVLTWVTEDFTFLGDYYRESGSTHFYSHGNNGPRYNSVGMFRFSKVEEEPTPVPEPTLLGGLSVLGFAGLLGKKRRKAQSVD
ncbi:PEP-CTERM sorting domain-containing protein [Laspinema olomoucense]|uniref:PEP-CTERM sorting domain-containing protein n=1 Tax=Laspinema olomoucense TaxID=3231600 RepID=UPI0021BA994F|nr:PEP-CTERM sorting domain-containing protein [Laspinema sp. D3c]MCT7993845.1 PEP-CTERM sorting domain-containing protein [Laspinema sp. D3c]